MTALGLTLLVMGAMLVVAETHVPGGALGVTGGVGLMIGGILMIVALGGGAALAVPVGLGLGAAAAGWTLLVTRSAATVRRRRIRAGSESLTGRVGFVRRWNEPAGQVFVEGALWRALHDPPTTEQEALREGDAIVVERVSGLTLCVRRAEEWEVVP
jgi:membrane-bound serine protease (ClpP class)